jgi:hypothetical protein
LIGFQQVQDNAFGQYDQLTAYLDGRGVPSVEEALREIRLQPIQRPYRELIAPDLLRRLLDVRGSGPGPGVSLKVELLSDVETRLRDFLDQARRLDGDGTEVEAAVRSGTTYLGALLGLLATSGNGSGAETDAGEAEPGSALTPDAADALGSSASTRRTNGASAHPVPESPATIQEATTSMASALAEELLRDRPEVRAALLVWTLTRPLGALIDPEQPAEQGRALFDEWLLGSVVERALAGLGLDDGAAMVGAALTRVMLAHEAALAESGGQGPRRVLERLLRDGDVRDFLGVNRHRDVLWFSQERFDALVAGLLATAITVVAASPPVEDAVTEEPRTEPASDLVAAYRVARSFREAESASNYQLERLLNLLPISPVR